MKSLPAIVTLFIIFAISGSKAGGYGQEDNPVQSSNGRGTVYGQSWRPTLNSQSTLDIDAQSDIYKKPEESEDKYYSRIAAQPTYETYQEHLIKLEILKVLLPDLPIWYNNRFYNYWTLDTDSVEPNVKKIYLNSIDNIYLEPTDQYYKRIFQKHDDENVIEYIRRICLLKTALPNLRVWDENAFIEYVKPNLIAYQKDSKVTNEVKTSSGSPSSFRNSRITVASNSPSANSNSRINSLSGDPGNPSSVAPSYTSPSSDPTILTPSKAAGSPVSPTASNAVFTQQTRPTTSTPSSLNTLPANSPNNDVKGKWRKQMKLKGGEYGLQEGETGEQYCKRMLQTDLPLKKKEYYKRIKNLKKVIKYKVRKHLTKLCKPYLLQKKHSAVSQLAPTLQQVPTMQQASRTQGTTNFGKPGA